mmetsp:Transcript_5801/g.17738  ORF Transcript_5801/g.17738 Transcript_5801/m.17738 type:complete len:208 (-) Transcript_5801:2430-3053(-)
MRRSCASFGAVMLSIEKHAPLRWLNTLRPPPGGAMAASSCMSLMCFTSQRWRSYQKPLSTHSLSSSSGGRNPNVDFCGMLRSSMKVTSFLPPTGANTPFVRFSSLPSIVSCSELDDVCAEKLMTMAERSLGSDSSRLCTTMVLPTPTLPTSSVCWNTRTSAEATKRVRTVSTVGTMILKNGKSAGGLYAADSLLSHVFHARSFGSMK